MFFKSQYPDLQHGRAVPLGWPCRAVPMGQAVVLPWTALRSIWLSSGWCLMPCSSLAVPTHPDSASTQLFPKNREAMGAVLATG